MKCMLVRDTAARSIRKQEAALMLGNGDDFHLGDAVDSGRAISAISNADDRWFLCLYSDLFSQLSVERKNTLSTSLPRANSLK